MPIYEYRCAACRHRFEELQKMSEPPVEQCPACGENQVTKLVSATAFQLKGSGWYSDHYGLKPSADGGDSSEASRSSESGSGDSGASESGSSDSGGSDSASSNSSDSGSSSSASPPATAD